MNKKVKTALTNAILSVVIVAIKDEITEDPEQRGYAGKNVKKITELLNDSYSVELEKVVQKPSVMEQAILLAKQEEAVPSLSGFDQDGNPQFSKTTLEGKIKQFIEEEVTTDPNKRKYNEKDAQEKISLLTQPYEVIEKYTIQKPSRINTILVGIPFAPNVVTEQEVTDALL